MTNCDSSRNSSNSSCCEDDDDSDNSSVISNCSSLLKMDRNALRNIMNKQQYNNDNNRGGDFN